MTMEATNKDPRFERNDHEDRGEKGHMSVEHTVWCGGCQKWAQYPGSKTECAKQAKHDGWKLTRKRAWLCSRCINKGRDKSCPTT